jgi:hypothetical protein
VKVSSTLTIVTRIAAFAGSDSAPPDEAACPPSPGGARRWDSGVAVAAAPHFNRPAPPRPHRARPPHTSAASTHLSRARERCEPERAERARRRGMHGRRKTRVPGTTNARPDHKDRDGRLRKDKAGGAVLSHRVAPAVPSAQRVFTSEFGMGSGGSPAP